MNDPFDPAAIEQQLRQYRPRSPQLDLDQLLQSTVVKPVVDVQPRTSRSEPNSESNRSLQRSISAWQLISAVAASWLIGVLVGGGAIYVTMNSPSPTAQAKAAQHSNATTIESDSTDTSTGSSIASTTDVPSEIISSGFAEGNSPSLQVTLDSLDWHSDEPLSVHSLKVRKVTSRLTTIRPNLAAGPALQLERPAAEPSSGFSKTADDSIEPAPVVDGRQLLKQFLNDPSSIIH